MEDQKWEMLLTDRMSAEHFELLHELSRSQPERIASWMTDYMERVPEGSVLLDAAYSLLPAGDWPIVIEAAIGCLRAGREQEAAASAIAYASLQCPQLILPYIRELFRLRPNANAYYSHWYCRGAGEEHIAEWTELAQRTDAGEPELEYTVWALLETRHEHAIEAAVDCLERLQAVHQGTGRRYEADEWLATIGYCRREGKLSKLYADTAYHLAWPVEAWPSDVPVWLAKENHPTWYAGSPAAAGSSAAVKEAGESQATACLTGDGIGEESDCWTESVRPVSSGGHSEAACPICGGRIHRLFTLDPIPAGLPVTGMPRLTLSVCLTCLGWEEGELFYRHDEQGEPHPCPTEAEPHEPQFPTPALLETRVKLIPAPVRWRTQDWALSNGRENLCRVGGMPTWIQDAQYPSCPECRETMAFIAQLDSDLPLADGGEWLWGSGGIGYLFWCDRCKVSGHLWQCT
ncbi:hypothetical protein L5D93_08740 [Paenibacillus thiaminolyticus]|nr:hypothetical protein [Paenibacillus thiaminolyticus]